MIEIRASRTSAARKSSRGARRLASALAVVGGVFGTAACGGNAGGSGSGDTLPGVILVDFLQSGIDNVPLNRTLEFRFSSPIDPLSVSPASIQIREGGLFGQQVFGKFVIQGSTVFFEPRLAGTCTLDDGGFHANKDYRVTFVGSPEEFALRNLTGDPLQATISALFHTRLETDPELFEDQLPGSAPTVVATTPVNGAYPQSVDPLLPAADVQVFQGNKVVVRFSENLSPCTVNDTTVLFYQYAHGDPVLGFVPNADQAPGQPGSWGSGTSEAPPTRVRSSITLKQDQLTTEVTLTPTFGEFPDNALLVVELTNNIKDFGGVALVPYTFSFVTQNRPLQVGVKTFQFDGDFPVDQNLTTGEVNSARSVSKAQGFLLFSGDGDNGSNILLPSGPEAGNPVACVSAGVQVNDGTPDDFDPPVNTLLSTGATRATCLNQTDGSTAVIFEFRSFKIRNGVTVRVSGVNAAIFLVRGDVNIEAGGRLLVRGDNQGGTVQGAGGQVAAASYSTTSNPGGAAVAGGGDGGVGTNTTNNNAVVYGQNGTAGLGSPDAFLSPGQGGSPPAGGPTRIGPGRGGVGLRVTNTYAPRMAASGGGAGHATAGSAGVASTVNVGAAGTATLMDPFIDGAAGSTYGVISGKLPKAEAGSGGGGGGVSTFSTTASFNGAPGGGGAGGGFVDFTASGKIMVLGTIDAAGSRGGDGDGSYSYGGGFAVYGGAGGGGGGSGGGIRLLTPTDIELAATTTLTVAGGAGGAGAGINNWNGGQVNVPGNNGGNGGLGRIALEDSNSVIPGIAVASLIPGDGAPAGFYRGIFDPSRFQGGGLRPQIVSTLVDMGPNNPTYINPNQTYVGVPVPAPGTPRIDFVAGIPAVSSQGINRTALVVEMQGFGANADGTPAALGTGWKTAGYFQDSGAENFPTWVPNANPVDVPVPLGNSGAGIATLNGKPFLQFRFSFYLKPGMGPFDAGPYIDLWSIYFTYDQ